MERNGTVREERGLCYAIGSFTSSFRDTGLLAVSTAVNKDAEKKALELVGSEILRFLDKGITEEELSCAREQMKSGIVLAMESTSARMNRLGSAVLLMGRCLPVDEIITRYDAVTAEDVLRLARQTLTPEGLGFSALGRLGDTEQYLDILR